MDNTITGPLWWPLCFQCGVDGDPDDSALMAHLLGYVHACVNCRKKWPTLLERNPSMIDGRASDQYRSDPLAWWHGRKSEVNERLGRFNLSLCQFRRRTEAWTQMIGDSGVWDVIWLMTYDPRCCPHRDHYRNFVAAMSRCFQRTRPTLSRNLLVLSEAGDKWREVDDIRYLLHTLDGNTQETLSQKLERYKRASEPCAEKQQTTASPAEELTPRHQGVIIALLCIIMVLVIYLMHEKKMLFYNK